ncbi:potassium channel family protein [Streptomyces sp. RB6PN25]|uniref:Potassium channel family protein n=1 Tax=Streptomyces humicola TaxID=2953240 RepID=A0ABT1PPF8_9ACTN|nr:potassium channel family protein [Streptomyces humicola]MCQ4079561.1 potassium channel family protein [Streptomyces humicola]
MTRIDALYLSMTVFTTAGFGDITAVTQAARIVTTVQMFGGLLLVGVAARVVVMAMKAGLRRRDSGGG